MKYTLLIITALLSAFFFTSCNKELDLTGDFEETAIIYCLLDKSDSTHMIKITRAFIGPGNSIEIAQIADSSYFDQVDATVTEFVNGNEARVWVLKDTIVTNKDENGAFYGPEQKLYYFKTPSGQPLLSNESANANVEYRLDVVLNDGEFSVSGTTEIVDGLSSDLETFNKTLKFAESLGVHKNSGIKVNPGNCVALNLELNVVYTEFEGTNETDKSFNWQLGLKEIGPGENFKIFSASGINFYNLIASSIEEDFNPAVTNRKLKHIEVIAVGAAEEFYNYVIVNKPSSALSQNKPTYTNMIATNGKSVLGIFSSRQTYKFTKVFISSSSQSIRCIDKNSTEELCRGAITGAYLFCSEHALDQSTTFAC